MCRNRRNHTKAHRHPRRPLLLAWVGAVLLSAALASVPVQAQTIEFRGFQQDHDRVQDAIDRTQEVWNEVNSQAAQSTLPGIRELVGQARTIQIRAKEVLQNAVDASREDGATATRVASQHLQNSLSLTLRARSLTVRAARQLREDVGHEESARRLIDRLREKMNTVDIEDARMRDQIVDLLDRAEEQLRDGRPEQAKRLAENADSVFERIDTRSDGVVDVDQVSRALERIQDRLEDSAVDGRRRDAIERILVQARQALDAGRVREAARFALSARRQLSDHEAGGSAGSQTERALERLDDQIERIQARFGDRLDENGERLLRQAGQARDRARRALESGNESQAQQSIRAAADLLARLRREAGRG